MKLYLKIIGRVIVFFILTVVTQTGGLIYLIWKANAAIFKKQLRKNRVARRLGFPILYLILNLTVTPITASYFGRVALPVWETQRLKPATLITCLLNRHYVSEDLAQTALNSSEKLQAKFPAAQLLYLDANFPFFDGFPLLPHWSHSDGRKLDLAFIYKSNESSEIINDTPTHFGYGSFDPAIGSERNTAYECSYQGYFQYSGIKYFTWFPTDLMVHKEATSELIKILHHNPKVEKIFIEPHLKQRWNLGQLPKIRFHGCHAVRHDDHIHFQVR